VTRLLSVVLRWAISPLPEYRLGYLAQLVMDAEVPGWEPPFQRSLCADTSNGTTVCPVLRVVDPLCEGAAPPLTVSPLAHRKAAVGGFGL